MSYSRKVRVTANELRDRFNRGYYWEQAEIEKVYEQEVVYEAPAAVDTNLPTGTLSQEILYRKNREFVARVHQYLLPGDQRDELGRPLLGGSGMPDPKELIEDDVWYHLGERRKPKF